MLASARRAVLQQAGRLYTPGFFGYGIAPRVTPARQIRSPYLFGSTVYVRNFAVSLLSGFAVTAIYHLSAGPKGEAEPPHDLSSASAMGSSHAVRNALVVDNSGYLYAGPIPDKFPIIKDTISQGRRILEMLTPEQATAKLRQNEESWLVERGQGVSRYDFVQIPSNDPIEDDHSEKFIHFPSTADQATSTGHDWMFWGVYDGHSGWTTSATLRQQLIPYVAKEINDTLVSSKAKGIANLAPTIIEDAIKAGFRKLDNEIVHESVRKVMASKSKVLAAELLAPALSGSCALLSFYDSRSKLLRVACTGDSRAVLGRRGPSGKWTAIPLSADQTGDTPSEVARLRQEHPDEPHVIHAGRVLGGLQPTRAFGDAMYKWDSDTSAAVRKDYYGSRARPMLKTPPYVTAEPVVTTTKVQPENGDFVVMATDGLWDILSNEEAIGLVGQWLDAKQKGFESVKQSSWLSGWFQAKQRLPLEEAPSANANGQIRMRPVRWGYDDKADNFIVEDRNAATHLARNALGGKDLDQLCSLLTLPSTQSRRFRDDLTIQVIFFDNQTPVSDKVRLNPDASAQVKPKL